MCKLFAISETKDIPQKQLEAILLKVRDVMSGQKDGFGFALRDKGGAQYMHRYVEPNLFQGFHAPRDLIAALTAEDNYKITGNLPQIIGGALIAHGRNATNDINLINTHPFFRDGWTIAHNGVVHHKADKPELPRQGTNDSEHLANVFTTYGADKINEYLTGMIAIVAISPENKLVILKDSRTHLYMAEYKRRGISRLVVGTSMDLIKATGRILDAKLRPVPVPCYKLITVDGNQANSVPVTPWEAFVSTIWTADDWEDLKKIPFAKRGNTRRPGIDSPCLPGTQGADPFYVDDSPDAMQRAALDRELQLSENNNCVLCQARAAVANAETKTKKTRRSDHERH